MNQSFISDVEDNPLEQILVDCLSAIDRGETVDVQHLLSSYPEHAEELSSFFDSAELVEQMAGPTNQEYLSRTQSIDTSRIVDQGLDTLVSDELEQRTSSWSMPHEFGRYRLLERLGTGAMGSVFRAHDARLGRDVAIKIPRHEFQHGSELQLRFEREAKAAAAIQHRNICPVYDVGEIDGIEYIAMSFLSGQTLAESIRQHGRVSHNEAIGIIRKLAEALASAHKQNVIHRDLKPANVMIDSEREPVIMDFGLALHGEQADQIRVTQHGTIVGTPAYMAPEQIDSETHDVGPSSDLYSLGVMFYELLTGRLPFDGKLTSVVNQVLTKRPKPPRQIDPTIPKAINHVCLKMLEKDPKQRFDSMEEVVEALSDQTLSQHSWGRKRIANITAAAFVALMIGFIVRSFNSRNDSPNLDAPNHKIAASRDQMSTANVSKEESATLLRQLTGHSGPIRWIEYSPDGSTIASCQGDSHVVGEIHLWDSRTGESKGVLGGIDPEWVKWVRAVFTSDSSKLVAVSLNKILVWDLTSQKIVKSFDKIPGFTCCRLLSDRYLCVGGHQDLNIRVYDLESGDVVQLYARKQGGWLDMNYDPSTSRLMLADGEAQIRLLDISDFSEFARLDLPNNPEPTWNAASAMTPDGSRIALSFPKSMAVWDTKTKKMLQLWDEDLWPALCLEFTPDGRYLIRTTFPGEVDLFDCYTGETRRIGNTRGNTIATRITPDGKSLVCGVQPKENAQGAGTLQFWQLPEECWPKSLPEKKHIGPEIAWMQPPSSFSDSASSTSNSETVDRSDDKRDDTHPEAVEEAPKLLRRLEGHQAVVGSVVFSPTGKYLASAARDPKKDITIRLWEVSTGKLLHTFEGIDQHESFPRFSPDETKLAAVGNGGEMKVWEIPSMRELWTTKKPPGTMSAAYLPDDFLLTFGDYNQQHLRLWDLTTGKVVRTYSYGSGARRGLQLSNDCKRVSLPLSHGEVRVLDLASFKEIARFQMPSGSEPSDNVAGALSPDGQRVALTYNSHVAVWNVTTKKLLHLWKDQGHAISLEFTPDGRHLMHAPRDGHVKILEVESGRAWNAITQEMFRVSGSAVSPDGKFFAMAGDSPNRNQPAGALKIWQLPESMWPKELPAKLDHTGFREKLLKTQQRTNESQELVKQARELIQRRQHNQAAKKLEEAIKLDPQNAEAYYQRALCSIPWSDHDKNAHHFTSMRYLDKSIKLNRENAFYIAERGLYLTKVADNRNDNTIRERAIADLTAAIELKNGEYFWWFQRAWLRSALAEHDGADSDYRQAIELLKAKKRRNNTEQTHLAFAYLNNCDNLIRKGDITGAMRMGDQAVTVAPGIPKAHWNRGRAYQLHHDYPTALEALDQAIVTMDGRYPDAFLLKTEIHDVLGELPQARDNAAFALQVGGGMQAALALAAFEGALGRYDSALLLFGKVLETSPDDAWAAFGQANALSYIGDFDGALASYTDATKLDPDNVIFLTSRARLLRYLGQNADADTDERKARTVLSEHLEKNDADADALLRRALLSWNQGRLDESIEDWNRVLRQDSRDVLGLAHLALLLSSHPDEESRDGQRALKLAKLLTELSLEKRAFFLSVRAAAHAENGDWDDAIFWQKKALARAPLTEHADYAERLALYETQTPFRMDFEPFNLAELFDDVVVSAEINVEKFDALQPRDLPPQPLPAPIIANQRPATVLIKSEQGFGTGMIIDRKGYVLTCAHVLPYAGEVTIHYDDDNNTKVAVATPIAIDHRHDVALLKFEPPKGVNLQTVQLGITAGAPVDVVAGSKTVVIGNPGDGQWVLQKVVLPGAITSERQMLGDFVQRPYIQVEANIAGGCSGGPLFDDRGRVIGIIAQKSPNLPETGFAVPMEIVVKFLGLN